MPQGKNMAVESGYATGIRQKVPSWLSQGKIEDYIIYCAEKILAILEEPTATGN